LAIFWNIPRCTALAELLTGELMSVRQAARELGLAASTIHRWLNDGFIAGEQLTPGAPWRIRVNDALKRRLAQDAPQGYVVMQEATKRLGVTRQTVLHRVQRGELDAVLLCRGRQKGLRIKVLDDQPTLFDEAS
jgi:transposase